ncbi:MAG: MFS transporter [Alphaproteobacteria bacterium]|nr:MFS transporter [Alphaproteobacteria bacterium]
MSKQEYNPLLLLAINTLHTAIGIFINTFMVAWFFDITGNDIVPACWFYIYSYAISAILFVALGPIVKCGNKLRLFRLSFIVNFAALLLILYLQENIIRYIWLLGVIIALEKAFFYYPLNVMTSQEVSNKKMIKFNGYTYAWSGITKILIPLLFGWLISVESFIRTTFVVLILSVISWILSLFLRHIKSSCKAFKIKYLIALARKRPLIKLSLSVDFVRGFIFETLDLLIVLYVVYMFKTNMNLGIFTSIFAICSVVSNAVFGRYCRYSNLTVLLVICCFLTIIGSSYFVISGDKFSFIIYNFIYASVTLLFPIISAINIYRVSKNKSVVSLYRSEYIALREIFLNSGRSLGFGLTIVVSLYLSPDDLKFVLLTLNLFVVLLGLLSVKLNRLLNMER